MTTPTEIIARAFFERQACDDWDALAELYKDSWRNTAKFALTALSEAGFVIVKKDASTIEVNPDAYTTFTAP